MRADRLLSLLMLLQVRGRMTAAELAERLEVSTRTIYRDLDALSAAGVPVYAERGPGGGCSLLDSYRTTLTGLKPEEVRALFALTVSGLLADLGAAGAAQAAWLKLQAALPDRLQEDALRVQERLHLDPAGWFQPPEPVPFLPVVQEAVWQSRRLRMHYRMRSGAWVKRLVDPYGLVAKAGVWYVVATMFGQIRVYRISRIQKAVLAQSTFVRLHDFDLVTFWETWRARFEASLARYEVALRVMPGAEPLLLQAFGEGMASLLADKEPDAPGGAFTLHLTFASAAEACRQLLGLGPAVEVVAPSSLRTRLQRTAAAIATLYAQPNL